MDVDWLVVGQLHMIGLKLRMYKLHTYVKLVLELEC